MRVSGSVAQKFRDGVVRINANQYIEHARLKDHVASMPCGLEAKIQEGGKQDLPSEGFLSSICFAGVALCETRDLVSFLHPNGTLGIRYAARQWCAVVRGCRSAVRRSIVESFQPVHIILVWRIPGVRSFGGDKISVRGWQTCMYLV